METTASREVALPHARLQQVGLAAPRFVSIATWCALAGMSRSSAYRELAAGNIRGVKLGRATKIDVEHGLAWMKSLPAAEFRAPRARADAQ